MVTTVDPRSLVLPSSGGDSASRLLAVYGIGRQLLEQVEPMEVIETILAALVEHLEPEHACILGTGEEGSWRPVAAHNLDLGKPFEAWRLSRTALRRAQDDGLAVLAVDTRTDEVLAESDSVQRFGIRSVMCVPLGRKPVRGLVYLDNPVKRAFTRGDLDFLTAISLYASLVLERAEQHARTRDALSLSAERLAVLREELLRHEIVGRSQVLLQAYDSLRRFARTGARVLLRGETGTGKELFARAYAANSRRSQTAYVPVPISALTASIVESELFGHVRGAFTEAHRDKKGRLELAHRGVLFLDEVGDIEPGLQTKLLRFLDSGELVRVGDTTPKMIDTLVISATNRPLERDVDQGRFRSDLFARLGHIVTLPPLRERVEDIPHIAEHYLRFYSRSVRPKAFSSETMDLLCRHHWPFNVRELQQVVERAVCLVDRQVIEPADLPEYLRRGSPVAASPAPSPTTAENGALPPLKRILRDAEKAHYLRALEAAEGNKRRAIELLQVSSETFYRRLREYGLKK